MVDKVTLRPEPLTLLEMAANKSRKGLLKSTTTSDNQHLSQRVKAGVRQKCGSIIRFRQASVMSKSNANIVLDTPCVYLAEVRPRDWRRQRLNSFVVLMFIHLKAEASVEGEGGQSTTTPRRVLLDTGADFNLISHTAHSELGLRAKPYNGLVHSIGGLTELSSTVLLQWHFRRDDPEPPELPLRHVAPFFVLPADSEAKFDCILGRPWIEEHWKEFTALVEANRAKRASASYP